MSDAAGWLLTSPARLRPTTLRLFCLPYAGGGASLYRSWARLVPAQVELNAVRLPGRENRIAEPAIDRCEVAVAHLADAIEQRTDLPYVLFGYSMGALLGFELARALRARGVRSPEALIVGGAEAPHLPRRHEPIHNLPHRDFVQALKALGGTPAEIFEHDELLSLVLPTLRADFALLENYEYEPGPALKCRLVTFRGDDDSEVDAARVSAWAELTDGPTQHEVFRGGHFSFVDSGADVIAQLDP